MGEIIGTGGTNFFVVIITTNNQNLYSYRKWAKRLLLAADRYTITVAVYE